MGNIICFNDNTPADDRIFLSNGAMDVFISVLALSGSALAKTTQEKRLVVWLSEKDQKVGRGTVGFDVVEMPWQKETFASDKAFMLKVIEAAEKKLDWKKLDYSPNPDIIILKLHQFKKLIERMTEQDINENAAAKWLEDTERSDPVNCGFPRCKIHNTLLTFLGCQICNN